MTKYKRMFISKIKNIVILEGNNKKIDTAYDSITLYRSDKRDTGKISTSLISLVLIFIIAVVFVVWPYICMYACLMRCK